jgi:F-type H+-transporting ATPase subunit alpha
MVELLKQPQFSPLSVGEQVITILSGSSGLLDDIAVDQVSAFASDMLQWLRERHPDYIEEINKTGKLSDELTGKLTASIGEFKTTYKELHP